MLVFQLERVVVSITADVFGLVKGDLLEGGTQSDVHNAFAVAVFAGGAVEEPAVGGDHDVAAPDRFHRLRDDPYAVELQRLMAGYERIKLFRADLKQFDVPVVLAADGGDLKDFPPRGICFTDERREVSLPIQTADDGVDLEPGPGLPDGVGAFQIGGGVHCPSTGGGPADTLVQTRCESVNAQANPIKTPGKGF